MRSSRAWSPQQSRRRQNLLHSAGYLLQRYGAADVYHQPDVIVDQVRRQHAVRRAA